MDLSIQRLTKSYTGKPVFKDLSFLIPTGSRFSITGPNGAGKSTLLKILSGGTLPSSGRIEYQLGKHKVSEAAVYQHVHFVAPYNTIIEELTLPEIFNLHQRLGLLNHFDSFKSWAVRLEYSFKRDQPIKMFSSGMKQRVRLGLALLDQRPLILLDEPGSNLDDQGKLWLSHLIRNATELQTIVIATNDAEEAAWCGQGFHLH